MKKVLSLVLAVVLVVGLSAVAFGAERDVNTTNVKLGLSGEAVTVYTFPASPDSKSVKFQIITTDGVGFTKEEIKTHKIGVQIRASEGSSVIKNAKIVYSKVDGIELAFVELNFVDYLVKTSGTDYSVQLFLTVDKKRDRDNHLTVSGAYTNDDQVVGEGDDYVFLGDTPVVEAEDYIKNIEVDLGQNVSIFTRMFEGKKYYGRVSQAVSAADEIIFNKYPDIDTVYNLDTINLSATGNIVKFGVGDNMFAYVLNADGELVFLGRTNDRLPYYTKYFLSSKELDIEEEIETGEPTEESTPEGEPEDLAPGGGDDAPENVNDNPGTGR